MFDLSPNEDNSRNPPANLSSPGYERIHQPQLISHFSSPEQLPPLSGDFATSFHFEGLPNMDSQYGSHLDTLASPMNAVSGYGDDRNAQTDFSNAVRTDPVLAPNFYEASMPKVPTSTIAEQDPFAWSPNSPTEISAQTHGLDFLHGSTDFYPQTMYHNTLDGRLVGNPSSQTFVTTSSEGGEQPDLITPPQETSPMLQLNQGTFQRRDSNSSDLTKNFDTIDLKNSQIGLGLYGTAGAVSTPNLISTAGLTTPEISPHVTAFKPPFGGGHDLASRRKRPRPAALQPDTKRSHSYTAPLTTSPHVRVSSPSLKIPSPVRRIKSTGNNMNVMNGRVHKPISTSSQMSPHNIQSLFEVTAGSEAETKREPYPSMYQFSGSDVGPLTPSSPATFTQQPQTTWQNFPPTVSTMAPAWNIPSAIAPGPSFSLPPSPPVHANAISPPFEQHPQAQRSVYHCPPQSAPPHLTSFFDVSPPPMAGENFHPTAWPTPSVTPPEPYRTDPYMPIPMRPSHALHHSHGGTVNYFPSPVTHFPNGATSMGAFQPCQPPFHSTPTPPQKDLDIKVELGPRPSLSQQATSYTFDHKTPKDFSPASNAKK